MKNLLTRSLTGIVFGASVVLSIIYGPWPFLILFAAFTIIGVLEFYKLLQFNQTAMPAKWPGVFLSISVFFSLSLVFIGFMDIEILFFPLILIGLIATMELYRKSANPILNLASSFFPVFYIAIPFSLALFLQSIEYEINGFYLLVFFAVLWVNDSMAYFTGMTFGKHRLFERISPKKSWEGFFGGLFFSIILGVLVGYFVDLQSIVFWTGYALIISLSATVGDLIESLFKRSVGVKDSGSILPGHGGVLDRFDGALVALPFASAFVAFLG